MNARPLALTALLCLAPIASGQACSPYPGYQPPSLEEKFAKASSVFVAHVWRTEELSSPPPSTGDNIPIIEATFHTLEILKGQVPADKKAHAPIYMCPPLMLLSGFTYIFFLDEAGQFTSENGTELLRGLESGTSIKLLSRLRAIGQQPQ